MNDDEYRAEKKKTDILVAKGAYPKLNDEETSLLNKGLKINAIAAYKDRTGLSLFICSRVFKHL